MDVRDRMRAAVEGTVSYPPDADLPAEVHGQQDTIIEVRNESCLTAGKRLLDQGYNPVVLNFASGTHPCGGWLHGSHGQEETISRWSCLFQSIRNSPMYAYNRAHYAPTYSDFAIYSPSVPVIRDENGNLLDAPYCLSIITAPAINARKLSLNRHPEIEKIMFHRVCRILSIGLHHQHDAIVLGSWGCGSYQNNPYLISNLFHQIISMNFKGSYRRIIFAILDNSPEKKIIEPFEQAFQREE